VGSGWFEIRRGGKTRVNLFEIQVFQVPNYSKYCMMCKFLWSRLGPWFILWKAFFQIGSGTTSKTNSDSKNMIHCRHSFMIHLKEMLRK
jgi:hypothetical protein